MGEVGKKFLGAEKILDSENCTGQENVYIFLYISPPTLGVPPPLTFLIELAGQFTFILTSQFIALTN